MTNNSTDIHKKRMKRTINWQKDNNVWPYCLSKLVIDPIKSALLIVDISNDSAEHVCGVMPQIIKLRAFFRQHKLPVIYTLVGSFLPDGRDRHIKFRLTWRKSTASEPENIRAKGTWAYQVRDELKPLLPEEMVVDKNSGSALNSSSLDHYLRGMDIQNLVICGTVTSRCVENTARDAADRGYNVILVEDACGDSIKQNHQTTMHTFSRVLGSVKSSSEVIADFSQLLTN